MFNSSMLYSLNKDSSKRCAIVSCRYFDFRLILSPPEDIHLTFHPFCRYQLVNSLGDISSISEIINKANAVIRDNSDGSTADQTLGILKAHISELKSHFIPDGLASDADSVASDASDLGNLTYTYEEEADP